MLNVYAMKQVDNHVLTYRTIGL